MSKNFKNDNPALSFISKKSLEPEELRDNLSNRNPPNGYKIDPKYIETKSKRFGLLLQPSIFNLLKKIADEKHISMNEAINESIKQYVLCNKPLYSGDCTREKI